MQVQITRTLEGRGTFHILQASNKVQMAKASKLKLQRQKIIDLKRLTRHSNQKKKAGTLAQICTLRPWEVGAGGQEFKVSLGYKEILVFKKKKNQQSQHEDIS